MNEVEQIISEISVILQFHRITEAQREIRYSTANKSEKY